VSKFYPRFPRNLIQKVVVDSSLMVGSEYVALLREKVINVLQTGQCAQNEVLDIELMFKILENPFKHLQSEYLRCKYFLNIGDYVPPIPYEMGKMFCAERYDNTMKGKYISEYGQYVPLDSMLQKFFELPGALKETLNYMDFLEKDSKGLHNFVQGFLWAKKRQKYSKEDIVFPLFVYFDDLEVNNPLGSHSGKLGAVYVTVPCLPPECCSILKNIFLVLLFESWTRPYFKNKATFAPLVNVLKRLENDGITIKSSEGDKHVYFVLALITGDNLGLNGVLGMVESFSANYFCRICKMHKSDTQDANIGCIEECALLRDPISYKEDLKLNDYTQTRLKEECTFHEVPSYHMVENLSVDELHDLREGLCNIVMIHVITNLINSKYFTLEHLNNRMLMFDYGPKHSINKPPCITTDSLFKKQKLKMTGSEILCFVRLFGVIVGDLVNEENQFWQLYLLLRQIMDIVLAKRLYKGAAFQLKALIEEHHRLFVSLTGKCLTPKMHFFIHYPRVIAESGPISHLSTIRKEAKHRDLTQSARSNMSRVNIAHSLAVKHQLGMCYRFISKEGIIPDTQIGSGQILYLNEILPFFENLSIDIRGTECMSSNWVQYKGTIYKKGMVVATGAYNLCPNFGKIKLILHSSYDACPILVCNVLKNIGLYEHVLGYEIDETDDWLCIKLSDLLDYKPLYAHTMATGKKIVVLHYSI